MMRAISENQKRQGISRTKDGLKLRARPFYSTIDNQLISVDELLTVAPAFATNFQ